MKKQMLPFLTEWLLKHGTNPTAIEKLGIFNMELFYKAMRKGYVIEVIEVSVGQPVIMKLTKEGVKYLQENQK
jgi:hypothetical protein